MNTPDMKAAALWYAHNGIPVFPCKPRGKEPLTLHGFKDATTDPAQIEPWWNRWPRANIGIPTGATTRLLVVDCDPRNGGPETRGELVQRFGPIPETAEQETGGGGRHLAFHYAGGAVPKSLADGIDLKGDGGYILVAPSIHPSGNPYRWDGVEGVKALLHPAEAPAWLQERISSPRQGASTISADGAKWGPGERNNSLASLAGSMRRRGLSPEAIGAALLEENRRRCDPPLPDGEVRAIAESVSRYPPGMHESAPAAISVTPWPQRPRDEAFYGLAGEWVRMVEPHTEADPAALLVQLLITIGNMIGRGPHYLAEADRHYTNLYAVIVGQTAKGRKGTSLGQVQAALREIDGPWCDGRIMGGLSSGEGLIWNVRDEIWERVPIKEKGQTRYEERLIDAGEKDKRFR